MKKNNNPSSNPVGLRRRAEERLKEQQRSRRSEKGTQQRKAEDAPALVQELQIHQIELEMQNEELRQARTETEALLHQYTDLYDFAPVGYFTLGREGEIRRMNLTGASLLGEERVRLVNRRFGQFVSPADRPAFNDFLQEMFTNQAATSRKAACEVMLRNQKDRRLPASETQRQGGIAEAIRRHVRIEARVTGDGQECRAVVSDITDRKRMEEEKAKLEAQTRQLQKAESLGRMAGAIAHHFNNQLSVVIGNLDLALLELPQDAHPRATINRAMNASLRAAEVSGMMLTYLGQSFDKREPLDLSDACRKSLPMLQVVMPVDVVLETDLPSPGPAISTNANYMQQVLTNLITNAWEAIGDDRGAIRLSVKTVFTENIPAVHRFPLDWQPRDNAYACLEVTDTGGGIADKDIEKLFDPFFTSKFAGRGMGLAVVLGIVRAHSGIITVESKPDRGSTFRVFFPVSGEEALRQRDKVGKDGDILISAVSPLERVGGGTVLLVEDMDMIRNITAAMLKLLGFSVLEAKDGVEAVEAFRQRQDEIRCVLCDLTMPRMNGWETLTALRKLAPDIPVILTSGYSEAQVMADDHPELPQVFLGKPFKIKGLSDAISQALVHGK
ncbi:MAG: PAS domain-containing sensor histidine kinase [Deltaproteobacteria bacterium]|nr:MAG: PAS domain-containing sensor histidine kinase [Deltaproteobacteria bacterium]